ncbi:MAG: DNA alkylation repair protein [Verrucomicrobiota bacterium]
MTLLESFGSEQTKKVLSRHGAREPFFGVKIGDLKKIQKKTGKAYQLALELFDTGNSDAMYLAAMIADEESLTKKDLRKWARKANWSMLSEYAVGQVAAETKHGWELGLEWIESPKENISTSGWSTLSNIISTAPNETLDLETIESHLQRIEKAIHQSKNREKYAMSGYVVCVACYVEALHNKAIATAERIGELEVETATPGCSPPNMIGDINKVVSKGRLGKKRKRARC